MGRDHERIPADQSGLAAPPAASLDSVATDGLPWARRHTGLDQIGRVIEPMRSCAMGSITAPQ